MQPHNTTIAEWGTRLTRYFLELSPSFSRSALLPCYRLSASHLKELELLLRPEQMPYSFGSTIPFCAWYLPLRSA